VGLLAYSDPARHPFRFLENFIRPRFGVFKTASRFGALLGKDPRSLTFAQGYPSGRFSLSPVSNKFSCPVNIRIIISVLRDFQFHRIYGLLLKCRYSFLRLSQCHHDPRPIHRSYQRPDRSGLCRSLVMRQVLPRDELCAENYGSLRYPGAECWGALARRKCQQHSIDPPAIGLLVVISQHNY
jgi:hypothetical protein